MKAVLTVGVKEVMAIITEMTTIRMDKILIRINGVNNNYTRVDDDPFANDGKTIDISDDDLPF